MPGSGYGSFYMIPLDQMTNTFYDRITGGVLQCFLHLGSSFSAHSKYWLRVLASQQKEGEKEARK